jgi:hypothetical protein
MPGSRGLAEHVPPWLPLGAGDGSRVRAAAEAGVRVGLAMAERRRRGDAVGLEAVGRAGVGTDAGRGEAAELDGLAARAAQAGVGAPDAAEAGCRRCGCPQADARPGRDGHAKPRAQDLAEPGRATEMWPAEEDPVPGRAGPDDAGRLFWEAVCLEGAAAWAGPDGPGDSMADAGREAETRMERAAVRLLEALRAAATRPLRARDGAGARQEWETERGRRAAGRYSAGALVEWVR